jgi:hypothetical protein
MAEHEITHTSTSLLFSRGFELDYLGTELLAVVKGRVFASHQEENPMTFKVAIIGAGSVGFTKKLFTDILCVPEFATSNSR